MRGACVILVGLSIPSPAMGTAQAYPYDPSDGFLPPVVVADALIEHECVLPFSYIQMDGITQLTCKVIEVDSLGPAMGGSWHMARYLRTATVAYDTFVDSIAVDQLVLVRREGDRDSAVPVWTLSRERAYEFLRTVEVAKHDGGLLVGILVCLNGTGGCYQEFLVEHDSEWRAVDQNYLAALQDRMPLPYRLHKGRMIDVHTLDGVQPLAAPGDANCCPSGEMHFEVVLVGPRMDLVESTLRVNTPAVEEP